METTLSPAPLPLPTDAPALDAPAPDQAPAWNPATRIAFRFCFIYFGLYVLTTQMANSLLPGLGIFSLLAVLQKPILWIGAHVFGIAAPISLRPTGSGDRVFNWLHVFLLLVITLVATIIWSFKARHRREHDVLFRRFRVFARFALATTMLTYGLAKAFPLQMPIDTLTRLVEPYGNFSPMGVLWSSIGSAPAYEMFVGLAETCCAILLFIPLTAPLGALMALMNSIAIFTLNMTYDVPVKLFSFHLILFSLLLIAPNVPRYFALFILRKHASIRSEPALGNTPRSQRNFVIAQVVYGACILLIGVFGGYRSLKVYGPAAPKSPLYGIWNIESMTIDNQPSPALVSDTARWRRVIFQRPTAVTFQRMNDLFTTFMANVDTIRGEIQLTSTDSARTHWTLSYQKQALDRMTLIGTLDHRLVHMELAYRDPHSYLQKTRGFHWISEFPFNQ